MVRVDGGEARTYEGLDGRYLLIHSAGDSTTASAFEDLAREFGDAVRVASSSAQRKQRVMLVRPDAYVAYDRSVADTKRAVASIRRLLSTHVRTS